MKVRAKNEEVQKVLYHPTGARFHEDGTSDWPDDSYTHRRIADGDVIVVEEEGSAARKSRTSKEA